MPKYVIADNHILTFVEYSNIECRHR